MRVTTVTGPGRVEVLEQPDPVAGPTDVLVAVKAVGICGSDAFYAARGGVPPRDGATPLGHEVAGQVVQVGASVTGFAVGDHVVVDPVGDPHGIIGNGGPTGGLADLLLLPDAVAGRSARLVPADLPWEVAALNEPMAVALHGVNRTAAGPGSTVCVFGAGPIGLGALLALKAKGAAHVVVVDVQPARLEKALAIGADAVIDSSQQDVTEQLRARHGSVPTGSGPRAATQVYLDAAGAAPVIAAVTASAGPGAVLGVIAVHKAPVPFDLQALMSTEMTVVGSRGYPTEIFEVTDHLIARPEAYRRLISHRFAFDDVLEALRTAATPGAADKVVVTFP